MKAILLSLLTISVVTLYGQTSVKLPGDTGKSYKIEGAYMGEMIRTEGGVDKTKEHYYLQQEGDALIIWKHILNIENGKTELLNKTTLVISDIDWAYFDSSNGDGPTEKKVSGTVHYVFSINATRGKRFKQIKYTRETPNDVTVGNLQIHMNDKMESEQFFKKLKATK